MSRRQRVPATLLTEIKSRLALAITQSRLDQANAVVAVRCNALFDPMAILRLRLDCDHEAAVSYQSLREQGKVSLIGADIDENHASLEIVGEEPMLRYLVYPHNPAQHHRRFADVEVDV